MAWGQCKGYGLQSGHFLLEAKEIADINSKGGVFCDHMQTLTSSAIVSYRLLERTTFSGQMLFASGLRTAENEEAKTNSSHSPSYTDVQFFDRACIPAPLGRAEIPARVRYHQPVGSEIFHQSGGRQYWAGRGSCGDAEIVLFSRSMVLLVRMLKRAPSRVFGSTTSSTYPKGTPPVWWSPAALLDGPFQHPSWAWSRIKVMKWMQTVVTGSRVFLFGGYGPCPDR